MRVESPAFTEREMRGFLEEVTDHERRHLIERLKAGSARLEKVVRAGFEQRPDGEHEWNAHDVLAHIVVLSKFYGMLTYQVGSGKVGDVDLLQNVKARDLAGEQLMRLSDSELLQMAHREHQRTITFIESAPPSAMQRRATLYQGFSMSALELGLLGLCNHLEIHLDQMEQASHR
jgi:hypothetical protein